MVRPSGFGAAPTVPRKSPPRVATSTRLTMSLPNGASSEHRRYSPPPRGRPWRPSGRSSGARFPSHPGPFFTGQSLVRRHDGRWVMARRSAAGPSASARRCACCHGRGRPGRPAASLSWGSVRYASPPGAVSVRSRGASRAIGAASCAVAATGGRVTTPDLSGWAVPDGPGASTAVGVAPGAVAAADDSLTSSPVDGRCAAPSRGAACPSPVRRRHRPSAPSRPPRMPRRRDARSPGWRRPRSPRRTEVPAGSPGSGPVGRPAAR
jgi:hypothetical protein